MSNAAGNASPSELIDARIAGLCNASLEGNVRRVIDLHEGDELDDRAFQDLVRAAAHPNAS